jgi:hypothetical protein
MTFWSAKATAESSPVANALRLHPDGEYGSFFITAQFPDETPLGERLAIADRVLSGVQEWRDTIAEQVERKRTSADELAAAQRRIAELEKRLAGEVR